MIRRPPRSTLFPSRRSSDLSLRASGLMNSLPGHMSKILHFPLRDVDREFLFFQLEQLSKLVSKKTRSEEHTSELQSQSNLVCRLLLEKKNKTQYTTSSCVLNTPPRARFFLFFFFF